MLKNSTIKLSKIKLDRQLKDLPSSIFHLDKFQEPIDIFSRKINVK